MYLLCLRTFFTFCTCCTFCTFSTFCTFCTLCTVCTVCTFCTFCSVPFVPFVPSVLFVPSAPLVSSVPSVTSVPCVPSVSCVPSVPYVLSLPFCTYSRPSARLGGRADRLCIHVYKCYLSLLSFSISALNVYFSDLDVGFDSEFRSKSCDEVPIQCVVPKIPQGVYSDPLQGSGFCRRTPHWRGRGY